MNPVKFNLKIDKLKIQYLHFCRNNNITLRRYRSCLFSGHKLQRNSVHGKDIKLRESNDISYLVSLID